MLLQQIVKDNYQGSVGI